MTYPRALRYLFGLQQFGVKLGLENIRALLAALGHPERAWPSLLITGSNGKGSVAAMTSAVLAASGHKVGTYTSPHLVRLTERIAIGGEPIPPRRLAAVAAEVAAAVSSLLASGRLAHHPTFFEVVTAMAFLEFARARVDVAVLEVGLGGRFDATNAADPVVSVVTTIALEHTRYLGSTVEAIAFEKAGIARPGRPLVIGLDRGPAAAVLRARARDAGADLVVAPRRVRARLTRMSRHGIAVELRTPRGAYPALRVPLAGRHQVGNTRVAVAALEALPEPLRPSPRQIALGLSRTRWPGRLEYVAGRPRLLLDGAHNPHAARTLAAYLGEIEPAAGKVLLFGCLGDKDVAGVLAPLARHFDGAVLTRIASPRAAAAAELKALLPARISAIEADDADSALRSARRLAGAGGLVVVTGSLYLVGEVKAILAAQDPPDQG